MNENLYTISMISSEITPAGHMTSGHVTVKFSSGGGLKSHDLTRVGLESQVSQVLKFANLVRLDLDLVFKT